MFNNGFEISCCFKRTRLGPDEREFLFSEPFNEPKGFLDGVDCKTAVDILSFSSDPVEFSFPVENGVIILFFCAL